MSKMHASLLTKAFNKTCKTILRCSYTYGETSVGEKKCAKLK